MPVDPNADTVELIPLRELIAFALLGERFLKALEAHEKRVAFIEKKKLVHLNANAELQTVRKLGNELRVAVREALAREQPSLPGMVSEPAVELERSEPRRGQRKKGGAATG